MILRYAYGDVSTGLSAGFAVGVSLHMQAYGTGTDTRTLQGSLPRGKRYAGQATHTQHQCREAFHPMGPKLLHR